MSLVIPYQSSGQEIGETRQAMTKTLMKDIESIINKCKGKSHKYYILVHAKPDMRYRQASRIKMIVTDVRPGMLLSCLLFGVNNETGVLTLEWALPGDWPTWSVGGTNEPVPETLASIQKSGIKYHYDDLLPS